MIEITNFRPNSNSYQWHKSEAELLADEQNDYKLRQHADKVFREYLLLTGVSKWKSNVMYLAVSGYAFVSKIFGKY